MTMARTALIIDDEPDIRDLIGISLNRIGFDTHTAANLAEARNLLSIYHFDVCLSDMKLPDGNGVDFVKYITQRHPHLPVAVVTAHGNMDAAVEAMKNGAFDFVAKPVDLKLLRKLVEQATQTLRSESATDDHDHPKAVSAQRTGETKTRQCADTLLGGESLIGNSVKMIELRGLIKKVSRTNAPIWITGESGTGKELIARLIHMNSARSASPFVAINCGAIPGELVESELFGHRKGSFTGAHSNHDGLFKQAEGGTLFLDEIAELPLHMQVKLLRTIQERTMRPVGSTDELQTNVRILSASHKDLAKEAEEQRFRHDLYYRLNVISIKSPPLRDRSEDILTIAQSILHRLTGQLADSNKLSISEQASKVLRQYSFPGNVRELENILERAVALCDSDIIEPKDLNVVPTEVPVLSKLSDVRQINEQLGSDATEPETILQSLLENNWNRMATAKALGLTYRQLRYRIQRYGLEHRN